MNLKLSSKQQQQQQAVKLKGF